MKTFRFSVQYNYITAIPRDKMQDIPFTKSSPMLSPLLTYPSIPDEIQQLQTSHQTSKPLKIIEASCVALTGRRMRRLPGIQKEDALKLIFVKGNFCNSIQQSILIMGFIKQGGLSIPSHQRTFSLSIITSRSELPSKH